MEAFNNLCEALSSMGRNEAYFLGSGLIGATITLILCLINLVGVYFDPNEESGDVYEAFLMTFGAPFIAFMLTGVCIVFAVVTSPAWILLILRKYIVKQN